jgi:hypothetical protein
MALVKAILGCFIAPKGLKNLAQGFNPGNHQAKRFALKGREIDSRLISAVNAFDLKPFQGYSQGRCGSQG